MSSGAAEPVKDMVKVFCRRAPLGLADADGLIAGHVGAAQLTWRMCVHAKVKL